MNEETLRRVRALNVLAKERGQSLARMALAWVLRDPRVTSALIGACRVEQIEDCVGALENLAFDQTELDAIEGILGGVS